MKKIRIFLLLSVCLAAGCVSPASRPNEANKVNSPVKVNTPVKVNPAKNGDATAFLTFADTFSNSSADLQKQSFLATNQALALNPNDLLHRMKLVIIYATSTSTLVDTPKAQSLLQQILQEDILANSQLAFANLMFDHLVAINKAAKGNNGDSKRVESLQQKNEALQIKLDATQQKLETSLQKLDAAQQKLDAAQQKLDELKKIEKSMGEREASPKK